MNLERPINSVSGDEDRAPLLSDSEYPSGDWNGKGSVNGDVRGFRGSSAKESWLKRHKRAMKVGIAATLGLVLVLLLLGVILSYTVAPGMIRNVVQQSSLSIGALTLSQPGTAQVFVSLRGSFDRSSPVPAQLLSAPFSLNYEGHQVGSLVLPLISFHGSGGKTPISVSSILSVSNMTAFAHFSKAMIELSEVTWQLSGETYVKVPLLFGLKVKVAVTKTVTMTGLDGLKSLKLENVDFTNSTKEHVKLDADVQIWNPSVVSLDPIGELSLAVYYRGAFMGIAKTGMATIVPGQNVIPGSAIINPSNLNLASDLISNFLSARRIDLTVSGFGNVSSIPLYSTALQGLTVNTSFIQSPPLQLIPEIDVLDMKLVPLSNDTSGMDVTMRAAIFNPLGPNCPLTVHSIDVNTSLLFEGLSTGHFYAPTLILEQNATSMLVNATTIFYIDQSVIFPGTTKSAFSALLDTMENQKLVRVGFSGQANIKAHVDALGDVSLKDLVVSTSTSILGLDRLQDATLSQVSVPGNAPGPYGSGLTLFANGTVWNPSVLSMNLGDVDMVMYANGTLMGSVTCHDFTMKPGWNDLTVSGVLRPSNLTAAAAFFRNYLTGINTSVVINGTLPGRPLPSSRSAREVQETDSSSAQLSTDVRYNIQWLNEAITALSVDASVPARHGYQAILSMIVVDLSLDFTRADKVPVSNGTMRAYFEPPFGFEFDFLNATISMDMSFNDTNIAHMHMPWHSILNMPSVNAFQVSVTNLPVVVTNAHQFSLFLLELFLKQHTTAGLAGSAAANVDCNLGIVPMSGIPFSNVLALNGTNRFQTPPVTVANLNLLGGKPGFAYISLQVNITNPSSAALRIGTLVLSLVFQDTYVGNGTIENMAFEKGVNSYPCLGVFVQLPSNEQASRNFLSQFIQGHPLNVSLEGTMGSTDIELLQLAMSNLVAPTTLPGFDKKLIVYTQLIFDLFKILSGEIPAQLTVFNPFDADIDITVVNVNVMYKGNIIALINQNITDHPIIARNHSYSVTPVMYGKIEGVSIDFFRTLTGTIQVTVNGTMGIRVGMGFETTLDYLQHNVSASFKAPPPSIESDALDKWIGGLEMGDMDDNTQEFGDLDEVPLEEIVRRQKTRMNLK